MTQHAYYLADDSNSVSNIETISNTLLIDHISARANLLGIKYIGLQGIEGYCQKIKEEIQSKLVMEYGNNNIEIEVIK